MPWAIKITAFSEKYKKEASYEPELHPGVTYRIKEPKATLKIFSTGSITVTGERLLGDCVIKQNKSSLAKYIIVKERNIKKNNVNFMDG